jgi:hypothetical protein
MRDRGRGVVSFRIRFLGIRFRERRTCRNKVSMTLKEILADPSVSYWLKDALRTACERDPVDALHDARRLLKLLGERYTQIVTRNYKTIGMGVTH